MCRIAQRPEQDYFVARLLKREFVCARPDSLKNQRHSPFFGVSIRYGERNPLRVVLIILNDDKLPRLALAGDKGRLDFHSINFIRQLRFSYNAMRSVHFSTFVLVSQIDFVQYPCLRTFL